MPDDHTCTTGGDFPQAGRPPTSRCDAQYLIATDEGDIPVVEVTVTYSFRLITPLIGTITGNPLTLRASSKMYVERPPAGPCPRPRRPARPRRRARRGPDADARPHGHAPPPMPCWCPTLDRQEGQPTPKDLLEQQGLHYDGGSGAPENGNFDHRSPRACRRDGQSCSATITIGDNDARETGERETD